MALGIYKKKNLAKKALDRYCNRHNYLQALPLEVSPPRAKTDSYTVIPLTRNPLDKWLNTHTVSDQNINT